MRPPDTVERFSTVGGIAGFYVWCSSCLVAPTIADHKIHCLKGIGRIKWWPWSRGLPCECPHNEQGMTADEVAAYLNVTENTDGDVSE